MASETESLREKLDERRDRLTELRRDESAVAKRLEELEREVAAERRRHELLLRQIGTQEQAIAAVEAALTVLTERLPSEAPVEPPEPTPVPPPAAAPKVRARHVAALGVLEAAEQIDLGNVSQRTRDRAENVRDILAREENALLRENIVQQMLSVEPTESKARTAVDVGLAVLIAEGRVTCVIPSTDDRWALSAPERASGNLGTQIQNFAGRTTRWPNDDSRTPPKGTLIRQESGSYEGGKRR